MDLQSYERMVKIELTPEERQKAEEVFSDLSAGLDALAAADDGGAEPLVSVLDRKNVLREDVSKQLITREELLANAPEQYDGYFQVPRTIEER